MDFHFEIQKLKVGYNFKPEFRTVVVIALVVVIIAVVAGFVVARVMS